MVILLAVARAAGSTEGLAFHPGCPAEAAADRTEQ